MHYGKLLREDVPNGALLASQHFQDVFGLPRLKRTIRLPAMPDSATTLLRILQKSLSYSSSFKPWWRMYDELYDS